MNRQQLASYAAKDFFTYSIRLQNLAPGDNGTGQFTIDANCDFLWTKATVWLATDDNGSATSNLLITINDTSTGRNLMNIPVPVPTLFGTGQLPFILPVEKLFKARATVQITVSNISDTETWQNLYFNFMGAQLFS